MRLPNDKKAEKRRQANEQGGANPFAHRAPGIGRLQSTKVLPWPDLTHVASNLDSSNARGGRARPRAV